MTRMQEIEEIFKCFTLENLYQYQQAISNTIKQKEAEQEIAELDRRRIIHNIITNETTQD